jgi:phytoene dehydrogenase-like protein
VPWQNSQLALAPTMHLGGTRAEIVAAENEVALGGMPRHPYVLISQPSVLDTTRAPAGHQVLWAYTHVPSGSTLDATELITSTVQRWAPGFRDVVLASSSLSAAQLGEHNPNYVGGDIYSGAMTLRQLVKRPPTVVPSRTRPSAITLPGTGLNSCAAWP